MGLCVAVSRLEPEGQNALPQLAGVRHSAAGLDCPDRAGSPTVCWDDAAFVQRSPSSRAPSQQLSPITA